MIKYNKLKAFTLAEIMILLLTLSILLAAFAPVFTRRYSNAGADEVWSYVFNDDNFDAYYDVANDNYTAQAFFGLTPKDKFQVQKYSSDENNNVYPSKVVIAASKALSNGRGVQRQMGFRFGNNAGTSVGYLFAGNKNILVGGDYSSIGNDTTANTSFGYMSLNEKTNSGAGSGNTAIGAYALSKLKTSGYNTAVGAYTSSAGNIGYGNTLIGTYAASDAHNVNFAHNTAVGFSSMEGRTSGTNNTAVGSNTLKSVSGGGGGDYNVAVGYSALAHLGTGTGNTAIGAWALKRLSSGNYNTAIGYYSWLTLSSTPRNYTTVIDHHTGISDAIKDYELIVIGGSGTEGTLEVHNKNTKNKYSVPIPNAGDETVLVNGNLIVRGATYLEVPLVRPSNYYVNNTSSYSKLFEITDTMIMSGSWFNSSYATRNYYEKIPKGLVAFTLNKNDAKHASTKYYAFSGFDGARREGKNHGACGGACRQHSYEQIRTNAICTMVNGNSNTFSTNMVADSAYYKGKGEVSTSYDWFSKTNNSNFIGTDSCDTEDSDKSSGYSYYTDLSTGAKVYLERFTRTNSGPISSGNTHGPGVDKPLAHLKGYDSPCPNLSSDRRLKNLGDKFTAGLDEIRKLNIYNYTFKNDPDKLPHVGVIAQELKLVFPNAVSKGEDGYYKIRWDEMFYAAINSIITLNDKIEKLAFKITTDKKRIAALKKDNAELNSKLDDLEKELALLEAKKHR